MLHLTVECAVRIPSMIYLSKILPIFVLPVGVTLLLAVGGLVLRRRALIWASVIILWLSSTPLLSAFLIRSVEGRAQRATAADVSSADAIVVLSSGRVVAPGPVVVSEWGDPDRFFGGVELFKAGKAPLLVFTGGSSPWEPGAEPEGKILSRFAAEFGVPFDRILVTDPVANTAEEAQAVATLFQKRQTAPVRILLVTSAFHISRARRLFERASLSVIPFPVDFQVSAVARTSAMDFLPGAGALAQTQMAIREIYGRLFYRLVSLSPFDRKNFSN